MTIAPETTTPDVRVAIPSSKKRTGVLPTTGAPLVRPDAAAHLDDAQVAALGAELDAIRDEVIAARGADDAAYIRRMIRIARTLDVSGRIALAVSKSRTGWLAGTGAIALGKVLENMEIGHNVLHGQWDWMRDPDIHSTTWEWDFVAPARGWQHTHNDIHHTWTNVLGKDRDVGYNILRVDHQQPWKPRDIANPVVNLMLAPLFEWGIASYDLEWDMVGAGVKSKEDFKSDLNALKQKAIRQVLKDYIASPAAGMFFGNSFKRGLAGTVSANMIRNIWAHSVIFCGHFPDGVDVFTEEMIDGETRGDWYIRQMLGSANLSGSRLFHILTGNLSHQIEHHCFPDLPSNRYIEVAPRLREVCDRYGLPYTTGPLPKQLFQTWKKICQLALPDENRWETMKSAYLPKMFKRSAAASAAAVG
ncbi:fatty acid desaturase family protein [Rudaeicoccus suwonensis]|uniref:Linoleoyl-CoA desaturase n=1 Tax=Rudaeicoccus suwonensis TaxID=657409 RepID=A0A561E3G8_9MICO|nr:acyl-CoA desaturase [Rudaeicoccus suwonensis]TWE10154.1 linoleoyl-CoA desaturase [Rudaeicoccus suwonensis]